MKFEIKARFTGKVLFSLETESLMLCVEAAVKEGAYLEGADLKGADLEGADLKGADLEGADLKGAYLKGADLEGADLEGADLKGADLKGAYLKGADLEGADLEGADLKGADLKGAIGLKDTTGTPMKHATPEESIANLDKVREIILNNAERLDMGHWHNGHEWIERTCAEEAVCGTSHCLAGWLQVCATDKIVRETFDTHLAGIVQAPVAAKMFFRDNAETLAWLKDRKYADEAADYA